jgi:hypothetical protein
MAYTLTFDEAMLGQLKKLGETTQVRNIITKMLNKMEALGPRAGNLVDSQLFIYEMKSKHPPLRLYYMHNEQTNELYVFEYEMKTSSDKQQKTIGKIRSKAANVRSQGQRA